MDVLSWQRLADGGEPGSTRAVTSASTRWFPALVDGVVDTPRSGLLAPGGHLCHGGSQVDTPGGETVLAATGYQANAALVVVAGVAIAGAVAIVLMTWRSRRPPRPPVGPASPDLGSETPALVDLVTGGFVVDDDAVPATAVDLAARRWFGIEQVGAGHVIIRLRRHRREDPDVLTAYERRVLTHIEAKAVDGIAPAAALTLGPDGATRRWWKGFVREVNAHAGELGLAVRRWDLRHLATVWGAVGLAWLATAVAASSAEEVPDPAAWGSPATIGLGLCVAAALALGEVARRVTSSDARAETPAGLEAASRWLGVRRWMTESATFEDKPAASVVLWERQLAYATALGLAPEVQRDLPFEVDHDRHAWSRATGTWRRVGIRYLPAMPSWGAKPWSVAATGLLRGAFACIGAWIGIQLARGEFDTASLPDPWPDRMPLIGLVIAVLAIAIVVWNIALVGVGVSDLFARRTVEGELVRKRRYQRGHRLPRPLQWMLWSGTDDNGLRRGRNRGVHLHLAVDDGSDDTIVAYRVGSDIYGSVREGARVRLRASPRLGHVSEIVEVSPPPAPPGGVADELIGEAGARVGDVVDGFVAHLGDALARAGEHDEMGDLLDRPDDDGQTMRQRLDSARGELQRAEQRGDGAAFGGLISGLDEALARLTDDRQMPDDTH